MIKKRMAEMTFVFCADGELEVGLLCDLADPQVEHSQSDDGIEFFASRQRNDRKSQKREAE